MDDGNKEASLGFGLLGEEEDNEPGRNRRAAVIVGVSTSAGLPRLASAGPMARSLGDWLAQTTPCYDVTMITDEDGHAVTPDEIFEAVSAYVTVPVRYELLLVYYIGHGFYQARNDIWMLSQLPKNRSACVSLSATLNDAQFCGIPNVVVVSDACRVLPGDLCLTDLSPPAIFPYFKEFEPETSCVDYIQATGRGTPAFEAEIDGARQPFLSHAFRKAYRHPLPEMVREMVLPGGASLRVVPNRSLEDFLKAEVARNLGASDAAKSQQVLSRFPSADAVFIAPVDETEAVGAEPMPVPPPLTGMENPSRGTRWLQRGPVFRKLPIPPRLPPDGWRQGEKEDAPPPSPEPRFETEVARLIRRARSSEWPEGQDPVLRYAPPSGPAALAVSDFETQTGLTLIGARVVRAAMTNWPSPGSIAESAPGKDRDELSVLRLLLAAGPVGELALALDDGRCLILPVMQGYIGHVALDEIGVQSLAYVLSRSNWRVAGTYPERAPEIERLRALATEAMDENRFQVGSTDEASTLADAIRNGKNFDPILGLLAAQAYSEAAMPERVRSVSNYMHADIRADFFDVRLLANRFWQDDPVFPVVPRCPMLTQNWALLGPRQASLPAPIARLQPFLTNALWTTFGPGAADILFDAIERGDL